MNTKTGKCEDRMVSGINASIDNQQALCREINHPGC